MAIERPLTSASDRKEVRDIVLVVPRDDAHVIVSGFNAFVHVYDETKGRSA